MTLDVGIVGSATGIEARYREMRDGAVLFLPAHTRVLAQGASDAVYSLDVFAPTSAAEVGARLGYGSPAHLIAEQLWPADGQGIGAAPVTLAPLAEAPGATAAVGTVTPVGTQAKAGAYRVTVSGVDSAPFVVPAGATVSDVCGLVGLAIAGTLSMPVRASYAYGAVTSSPGASNTGDGTLSALASGSAVPGTYALVCTGATPGAETWRLTGPDGSTVATLTAAGASIVYAGGPAFTLTTGAAAWAVGDSFAIVVAATAVTVTSAWTGESANALRVSVIGPDHGITFGIAQPSGGLLDPALDPALAALGNEWIPFVLHASAPSNTDALDALQARGEALWGPTERKPFIAFVGNTSASVDDACAVVGARRDDRINAQLVAPGSASLPFVAAASQVAQIARVANSNPPVDYTGRVARHIAAGADADNWDGAQREKAVKLGTSTIELVGAQLKIVDVVTCYRPVGVPNPAYRFVVDIVKIFNSIYNVDLAFAAPGWQGAPLIPDEQATVNPAARKPKSAVAEVNSVLQSLGDWAIIADPARAKKLTRASIDAQNHRRLNVEANIQISGNTGIKDVTLFWGFYLGTAAAV